jgi:hypothetical protein
METKSLGYLISHVSFLEYAYEEFNVLGENLPLSLASKSAVFLLGITEPYYPDRDCEIKKKWTDPMDLKEKERLINLIPSFFYLMVPIKIMVLLFREE